MMAMTRNVKAALAGTCLIITVGSGCASRTHLRGTPLPPRVASPSGYLTYQSVLTRFLTDRGTFTETAVNFGQAGTPRDIRAQSMQGGQASVTYRSTLVRLNGCTLLIDVEQRNVDERVQSAEQRVHGAGRTSYTIPLRAIDPASIRISGVADVVARWVSIRAIDGQNAFEMTYGTRSGTETASISSVGLRVQDEESAVHIGHAFADAARECGNDQS